MAMKEIVVLHEIGPGGRGCDVAAMDQNICGSKPRRIDLIKPFGRGAHMRVGDHRYFHTSGFCGSLFLDLLGTETDIRIPDCGVLVYSAFCQRLVFITFQFEGQGVEVLVCSDSG